VSQGYQLNNCWILKFLSGTKIFKLLNLCGNQNYQYTAAANVFVPSIFGENIPTVEFGTISVETPCWDREGKIAKFLMRTFTCRSTILYVRITQPIETGVIEENL
jgi:hypothetical protein